MNKCDNTSKVCNEDERYLFTMTSIDSMGKTFALLRAFLPHEKAWVFKWLFQTVLPNLFPKDHFQGTKLFITDGDSQECNQLDYVTKEYFPQSAWIRCGWHIVDRGWKQNGPRFGSQLKRNCQLKKIIQIIKQWMYSWMTTCKTREECMILGHPENVHQETFRSKIRPRRVG